MNSIKLAIDLGGTNIRIARVENGQCTDHQSVPCPANEEASVVVDRLSQLIEGLIDSRVKGIGIGVPSIVDAQAGIVYDVANIASWKEVPLKALLEEKFQVPVAVENDCNCFALGECMFGAGRDCSNMVGVTIGTGIGAGIIIGRKLYGGLYRGAGEIGTLPYLDADFEHYCSSFFFKQKGIDAAEYARKAQQGDREALNLWDEFGGHIGQLIKGIIFTYAPEIIVFGGGISSAFPLFKEGINKTLQNFPYKRILELTKITISTLKNANLLGASSLFPN